MQAGDREQFLKVMNGMAAIKRMQLTAEALDLWWAFLADWSIEDFKAAAIVVLKSSPYMPQPADFENLRKSARLTAGEAFAKAVSACGSAIQCGQVTSGGSCGDPLIDRAVRAIGGYGVIAMCQRDSLHFLERRFTEHYEAMQDADHVREALPELVLKRLTQGRSL